MFPGTWGGQAELQTFGGLVPGLFADVTAMATTGEIYGGRARIGIGSRRWGRGTLIRCRNGGKTGDVQLTSSNFLTEPGPTTLVGDALFVFAEGRTGRTMAYFGLGYRREEGRDVGLAISGRGRYDVVNFNALELSAGYAFGQMGGVRANLAFEMRVPEFPLYTRFEFGAVLRPSEDNIGWTSTLVFNLLLGGSFGFDVRGVAPDPSHPTTGDAADPVSHR